MTSGKQNNGTLAKPFTPSLSAAFNRNSKSPLTPKLASPGGYRTPKRLVPSEHPSSTPNSEIAFLNANITPRSGPRNNKRDGVSSPIYPSFSGQSSPRIAYSHVGTAPGSNARGLRTDRSPIRGNGRLEPSRGDRANALTPELPIVSRPSSFSEVSSGSRMFFHAYDARSPTSSEVDFRTKPPSKPSSSSFLYANGEQEQQSPGREIAIAAPTLKRRSIGSTRSMLAAKPLTPASPRLRPTKVNGYAARGSDDVASQVGSVRDDLSEISFHAHSTISVNHAARPPFPTARHFKSPSLDSVRSSPRLREGLRPSPIIISPAEPQIIGNQPASELIPGRRPRIFSNGSIASIDTHASAAPSPVKSESSGSANNGVVLNARIERKILDLEISNSSLLAINRTLEREMRKQNAELRRYRRLSRSGRLSMVPSTRSFSGTSLSITNELDEETSDLPSMRSPEEMSEFSDEGSTLDESVLSPDSLAEHDARHCAKDEKRFFIDLAKHQELLADSQKINQSLRRCLGWTEELIREGKKALEYSVHVNDIQLGGRVLPPEELLDAGESAKGLLSPVGATSDALLPSPDLEPSIDLLLSD